MASFLSCSKGKTAAKHFSSKSTYKSGMQCLINGKIILDAFWCCYCAPLPLDIAVLLLINSLEMVERTKEW